MAKRITYTKTCLYCGDSFVARRSHARFCCDGCRASYANRTKNRTTRISQRQAKTCNHNINEPPRNQLEEYGVRILRFWSVEHHDRWMKKEIENEGPWGDIYHWRLIHVDPDGTYYYSAPRATACQTIDEYWFIREYWLM